MIDLFTRSWRLGLWWSTGSSFLARAFSSCNTNCERDSSSSSLTAKTTGTLHIYQMETLKNSSSLLPFKIGRLFWKISQIINHYPHGNMLSCFSNVGPRAIRRQSKREIIFPQHKLLMLTKLGTWDYFQLLCPFLKLHRLTPLGTGAKKELMRPSQIPPMFTCLVSMKNNFSQEYI